LKKDEEEVGEEEKERQKPQEKGILNTIRGVLVPSQDEGLMWARGLDAADGARGASSSYLGSICVCEGFGVSFKLISETFALAKENLQESSSLQ
jgi:hypothetical protein